VLLELLGRRSTARCIRLGFGELERWDVARVWRGVTWDKAFPGDRMVPALEASLADLGVDLRSQQNVLDLQDEIERLEELIADRREFYNDSVFRYNTRIGQLPALLLAGLFGWLPRPFFRPDPADLAVPSTELRPA